MLLIAGVLLPDMSLCARQKIELHGDLVQGGMVTGRVEPGTRVDFEGRKLRISPEGWFTLGLNRDQGPNAVLEITHSDGGRSEQIVNVRARKYDIQRIDGLPSSKVSPSTADLERIGKENALIGSARMIDSGLTGFLSEFSWPVIGRLSGVYGSQRILNGKPKRPHYGVDIAAPTGTPVRAPAPGKVTLVHPDMFYTGVTVNMDHGHGVSSIFIHMSETNVVEGQELEAGEEIGKVGATGRATGPHLHWGMNWFKVRLDPALLAGEMPAS
jgi:murein DD-endopeptidase MepM/ murein hydrolase activator NlpD